jgi:nicotinamidase-related amidase
MRNTSDNSVGHRHISLLDFPEAHFGMIIRANNIETLVLFGIATSGVVLSTLRKAADADYSLVVIKDCCTDPTRNCAAALDTLFPKRAQVLTASESLDHAKHAPLREL